MNNLNLILRISLLLLFFLTAGISYSQNTKDSIEVKQRLGKVYFQNGKILTTRDLNNILLKDNEAAKELRKANANLAPTYLLSFSGGFLIGWPIGIALGGGEPQWWMAAAGTGLILCSIPFQSGYNKHVFKAVTIYNSKLKNNGMNKTVVQFGLLNTGVGIGLRF